VALKRGPASGASQLRGSARRPNRGSSRLFDRIGSLCIAISKDYEPDLKLVDRPRAA
jgi:hypothetical protein